MIHILKAAAGNTVISWIDSLMDSIRNIIMHLLHRILFLVLDIARIAYVVLAVVGAIMWATGFSPYQGRRMLFAAILTALVVEAASRLI